MSATNRGALRDKDDHYVTPAWAALAIFPHLPMAGVIVDAGCGEGAIGGLLTSDSFVIGVETDTGRAEVSGSRGLTCYRHDYLSWAPADDIGLVISNPPFRLAQEFIEKSLRITAKTGGTVAMLLRLNWMASMGRAQFHRRNPSDIYVLPRRPSFQPNGKTDSTEYGWFCWGPGRGGRWSILDVKARAVA